MPLLKSHRGVSQKGQGLVVSRNSSALPSGTGDNGILASQTTHLMVCSGGGGGGGGVREVNGSTAVGGRSVVLVVCHQGNRERERGMVFLLFLERTSGSKSKHGRSRMGILLAMSIKARSSSPGWALPVFGGLG